MSAAVVVRVWMWWRFWCGFAARAAQPSSIFASPTTADISTAAKRAGEMPRARRRRVISGVGSVGSTMRPAMWTTALAGGHRWRQ